MSCITCFTFNSWCWQLPVSCVQINEPPSSNTLPSIKTEKVSPTVPQSTKVKRYYNMHARNLPSLIDGQSVRAGNGESWWVKGKVVGKARQPRSYVVKTETGSTIRRNRRDLLTTPKKFELREIPDYESELSTSPAVESRPHQETQLVTSPTIPMPNQSTRTSPVASANDNNNEQCTRTCSGRIHLHIYVTLYDHSI